MSRSSTDGDDLDRVPAQFDNRHNGKTAGDARGPVPESPEGDGGSTRRLTDRQKKILAVALVVHAILAILTWRDLRRRTAAGVRGPKWLWRAAATLNTSGSLLYWLFGRRHRVESGVGRTP